MERDMTHPTVGDSDAKKTIFRTPADPNYERLVGRGSIMLRAIRTVIGSRPFTWYRHTRNAVITPFLKKPQLITKVYKDGMRFWDLASYHRALRYYLTKRQSFEEYMADRHNEPKEYIDLDFSVYYQVYNNKRATFAALKSFRQIYPDVPILLVCDGGADHTAIAKYFNCEYYHDPVNIGYWPCKDMYRWFQRIARAGDLFKTEWILILEDDIRTRDRISKYPHAHLSGQGGSSGTRIIKQLSPSARAFIRDKYPETENFGISGCGGSILHRASFMKCLEHLEPGDLEQWITHEPGIPASDIALTFLFLINGYTVRRWLDLSHDSIGNWGQGSAFDHQYKYYYHHPLAEADERMFATLDTK